ncbi:hypothetical protein PTTG_29581 [Puccinia triticina 1-1 BBBD Race 1]|uniref:CxC1 domain-containing protein n=1 Tax=Puccinia triticina (isolate 1-1 / race 1 (BBBD)) TaxID=630390 RepID=A0A180G371_PUCT1|nr:hypothetical protein PTTG_29581 [Puccinia triticina 1-1 BBBD Race 1]
MLTDGSGRPDVTRGPECTELHRVITTCDGNHPMRYSTDYSIARGKPASGLYYSMISISLLLAEHRPPPPLLYANTCTCPGNPHPVSVGIADLPFEDKGIDINLTQHNIHRGTSPSISLLDSVPDPTTYSNTSTGKLALNLSAQLQLPVSNNYSMARGRRNEANSVAHSISTGSSRRTRTRRFQMRNASMERRERSAELRDRSIAEQLGHVSPPRRPPQAVAQEALNTENQYPPFEPHLGGNDDRLATPEEDLPSTAHAAYHRARRYAETRERTSQLWSQLESSVTATFTLRQRITTNFTTQPSGYELPPDTCTCSPSEIHTRKVDLFDMLFQLTSEPVPFCKCLPDVVRLVYFGYIASSPETPRTAFSIRLLQFHHMLWQTSALSTSSFVKALSSYLNTRHKKPCYARGNNFRKQNLEVPFSNSTDLYSRVLTNQTKITNEGMQLTAIEQWAMKCPRCFGPQENEIKAHQDEPDIIIAMDGNFQQRHYAYASKDNPPESKYPSSFIPPSKIAPNATLFTSTEAAAVGIDPPCADTHKAANDTRNETTWEKCDDNGLFASACCHDIPLKYINIYKTGEKLYYPVSILRTILADFPQHKVGILYDLGCHMEAHVNRRNLLEERRADLRFGTSVFHAYVHEWSCQVKYNPRLNKFWGLSDGEGLERLWSFQSPLISTNRVSTRLHRFNSLDARSQYYTKLLNEMGGKMFIFSISINFALLKRK